MSENKDSWKSDFWKSLNNDHRFDKLNNLKSYILTLVLLKHISDNQNTNTGLNIKIPIDCDFQSILNLCHEERPSLGDEINIRLNSIARENSILDDVINFVDFNYNSVIGEDYKSDIILGNIMRLIEDYSNRHNSSENKNNTIWADLFDFLMQSFEENNGKYAAGITTPNEVGVLMAKLIGFQKDNSVKSIYDPICGTGNLLFSVFKEVDAKVNLYGEEINIENVFLAKLTLLFHGITNYDLKDGDVLNYPSFTDFSKEKSKFLQQEIKKFDYIVSNPPFGLKNWYKDPHGDLFNRWNSTTGIPSKNNADYAYILHIVNSLKESGTAACIISPGVLFRGGSDKNIRKYLVDRGFIKGIVGLPAKLFYGTGIPSCILILGNQPNDNKKDLFIIDASSEFLEGRFLNKLLPENINRIVDTWENSKEENEFSRLISYNEIVENDYNLNIPRYLVSVEEFQIPEDSKVIQLASLLNNVSYFGTKDESGKLIKISDLSNNSFLYDIDIDLLDIGDVNPNFFKLTSPSLLISRRFNKLKPSFCNASLENPVYISSGIAAFTVNNYIVDLSYLILQLDSEYVAKQVGSFSGGIGVPSLKKDDLLKIKIVIPNLEAQDSIIRQKALAEGARLQSDKSKIESLQLQSTIDTLLKERMNDFQWTLHDLRNGDLLSIKNKVSVLQKLSKIDERANDIIVDSNNNVTLISFINKLADNVTNLSNILAEMFNDTDDFGRKERINLIDLVNEFIKNQQVIDKANFYFNSNDLNDLSNELDEGNKIYIEFNKKDFIKICTNVFENIKRHAGFFDESNEFNNIIKLSINLDKKTQLISFSFLNTGNEISISQSDYFSNGGRKGINGNSGKGGFIIKELAVRNNAKAFQNSFETNKINDFAFEVGLTVKYFLDEI